MEYSKTADARQMSTNQNTSIRKVSNDSTAQDCYDAIYCIISGIMCIFAENKSVPSMGVHNTNEKKFLDVLDKHQPYIKTSEH